MLHLIQVEGRCRCDDQQRRSAAISDRCLHPIDKGKNIAELINSAGQLNHHIYGTIRMVVWMYTWQKKIPNIVGRLQHTTPGFTIVNRDPCKAPIGTACKAPIGTACKAPVRKGL